MRILLWAGVLSLVAAQDPPRFTEKVEVARVLIDVRAVDRSGRPLFGLSTPDFRVKIDGKPARVESVQWVTGALNERPPCDEAVLKGCATTPAGVAQGLSPANSQPVAGRLVVFLFQKSLEKSRIVGFMRMLLNLRGFLEGFTPHDRLAILSFDSRLRLWLDFTGDMDRVRDVLSKDVLFGGVAATSALAQPSLLELLDPRDMERSATIESAIRLLAEALEPLPGAKSLVLVGHGFAGRGSWLPIEHDYDAARAALHRARASVFSLDITEADRHTLESGLQMVADDTGGFFERTHIFTKPALDRLAGALAGHYVLIVEKPTERRGTHRIDVKLQNRDGTALARTSYID